MSIDVALIHPPVALPCEPPVGLGVLAAGLRAQGLKVRLFDASIESSLRLLGASLPAAATTRARRAVRNRERSLALLRGAGGYRCLDRYRSAVDSLTETLRLASPPQTRVGLANYLEQASSPLRSQDLRAAAAVPERSPFYSAFAEVAERVAGTRPRLIGLSVAYLHQALPALALAGTLRRRLPAARILLGGALLSCWRGRLSAEALQPAVDQLVFDDGLSTLLSALGQAEATPTEVCLPPDYSDLPFSLYLAPEPIAPVPTSRGCFWGRCRYCPEAVARQDFQMVPPPQLADFLETARRRSGSDFLHLSDSAIPPQTLLALSRQRWSARWYGFARFVPELASAQLCLDLRRSGCRMLQLGLESGSPRVLGRLRKGIHLQLASRVLKQLADAGVGVYLYLMFGVPGEQREDAQQTLEFVAEHASLLSYLNTSLLNLPLQSPTEPDLQLVPLDARGENDLGLYTGFRHRRGWDRRQARRFLEREFHRQPEVSALLRRTPPVFGANHAPFFSEAENLCSTLSEAAESEAPQ